MVSKVTYNSLINNKRFVNSAYRSLVALGETPNKNPKDVVDDFLSKERYFENNFVTTLGVASSVKKMSPRQKAEFGAALSLAKQIPDFHKKGGAPAFDAIKDHLLSAIADPTNILGAFAGMASFGVGGAAVFGAKETAKQTTKNYLKAKLRASLAPMLTESAVTGAGSSFRNIKKQQTEIDIGNRTDIDLGEAALVGTIEGPASVLAGGALSAGLGAGIRTLDKTIGDTGAARWFVNNMLPRDVGKEFEVRLAEQQAAESKTFQTQAYAVGEQLNKAITKSVETGRFTDREEAQQFVNDILAPGEKKLRETNLQDASIPTELKEAIGTSQNFIKDLQRYAQKTRYLKEDFSSIFNADKDYARQIYEVFSVSKRSQTFDKFVEQTKQKGTDVVNDLLTHARANPDWVAKTVKDLNIVSLKVKGRKQFVDSKSLSEALSGTEGLQWAESLARRMYEPVNGRGFKLQGNVTEARKTIPEFQKLIWGKNYSPSQRLVWSVAGILDSIDGIRFGTSLSDSLLSRNKAVRAATQEEAAEKLNAAAQAAGKSEGILESDVIRVVGSGTKDKFGRETESLVAVGPNRIISDGEQVWISRAEAERLAPAVSPFLNKNRWQNPYTSGTITQHLRPIARLQGTFKLGKTVYNPIAHMRNALGAAQAFVGSGAWVRTRKELQALAKMSKAERAELIEGIQRSGITSTSVELEQILTRLGREITEDPGVIEKFGTLGLAGTRAGKAAMKLYQGTDNIAKISTYLSELGAEKELWKTLTPEQKLIKIRALNRGFGKGTELEGAGPLAAQRAKIGREGFSEEQAIAELAAQKTLNIMPVYTRVPLVLEKMAAVPVIGNFSAYPAEVFRNAWNIFRLGAKEMEEGYALGNKALITKGGTRMASMYGLAATPFAISQHLNTERNDEQKVESLRDFLPSFHQYGAVTLENLDPKTLEAEYLTWDYSNPYQPLTAIVAPVMQGIADGVPVDELLQNQGLEAAKAFVSPFTDPSLVLQGGQALFNIATNLDDPNYDSAKDTRAFVRSALPSFVKLSADATRAVGAMPEAVEKIMYPKAFGEYRQPPKDISELGSILQKQGFNPGALKRHKINLKTSSGYALRELNRNSKAYWNKFYKTLQQSLRDPNVELDPVSLLEDYEETLRVQYAAQQGLAKLYVDLKNLVGKAAARKIFFSKDLQGVVPSKAALYSLLSDAPRTNLKRLSNRKAFWKGIAKARRKPNTGAWRTELARIERKYNFKDVFEDPVED
jgi:hypothetical protein